MRKEIAFKYSNDKFLETKFFLSYGNRSEIYWVFTLWRFQVEIYRV